MFKIFEGIGSIIAMACLIEMASNPKQVVRDIQNGPVLSLTELNHKLVNPKIRKCGVNNYNYLNGSHLKFESHR